MDWRIWLAFGVGLFIGANLIILLIGLLVAARENKETRPASRRMQGMEILKRREYANLN